MVRLDLDFSALSIKWLLMSVDCNLATKNGFFIVICGKSAICHWMPSVLWRCWLGGRKGIRPVKTEWWGAGMVICLERDADLHMAQLMPLLLTVSCFSKILIGFSFLVPAHPGSPGQRAVKWMCVCVLYAIDSSRWMDGPLSACIDVWMVSAGMWVLAKYADGKWYRAQVTRVLSYQLEVELIDFGTIICVSAADGSVIMAITTT